MVAAIVVRPPDAAALAVARAFGARIVREGRIPLVTGNEIFSVPHAWDGGLGWLGALAAWCSSGAGPAATTVATVLLAFVALGLTAVRTARRAPPAFALGAAVLAAVCAADALRDGAGIENAAFAAALALVLERPAPRAGLLATLLALVWCNASPAGLLAPVLAALAALGVSFSQPAAAERRWAWLALAGTALATFATPAGIGFPALAGEALRLDRGLDGLVPYHPVDVSDFAYRAGFTLATLLALAFGAGRLRPGDALVWAAATLLALANGTFLPIFGVLVAPLLAASAADLLLPAGASGLRPNGASGLRPDGAAWPKPVGLRTREGLVAAVAALVLATFGGVASAARMHAPAEPALLGRSLAADGRPHRLFCATIDWCGVAEAAGAPFVSGYMDGRVEAFPLAVRTEQLGIARLKGPWRGQLERERVDAVLVRKDRAFATLVAMRPGWRLAGSTETLALYVRRP